MRAGIIGLNWGRVHVGALRKAGVEVAVMCGRDARRAEAVAREENVPFGTDAVEALDDLDLVVIATPSATHDAFVRRFAGRFVICEKPYAAAPAPTTFVNYAFPFVSVVSAAERCLVGWASIEAVRLRTRVSFEAPLTARQWLTEVGAHPLAWILHIAGPGAVAAARGDDAAVELALTSARGAPVTVTLETGGPRGIDYAIDVEGTGGHLAVEGRFAVGHPWSFRARLDGAPLPAPDEPPGDPWFAANERCVRAMVERFADPDPGRAADVRLYDAERAVALEDILRAAIARL